MYNSVTVENVKTAHFIPVTFGGKFHAITWDSERGVFHVCGDPNRVINHNPSNGELTLLEGHGIIMASPRAVVRYVSASLVWRMKERISEVKHFSNKEIAILFAKEALTKLREQISFPLDLDPLERGDYEVQDLKVDGEGNLLGLSMYAEGHLMAGWFVL